MTAGRSPSHPSKTAPAAAVEHVALAPAATESSRTADDGPETAEGAAQPRVQDLPAKLVARPDAEQRQATSPASDEGAREARESAARADQEFVRGEYAAAEQDYARAFRLQFRCDYRPTAA